MKNSNYTIVKNTSRTGTLYFIHDIFYTKSGHFDSISYDYVTPIGESVEDLKEELLRMLEAFDKPIITKTDPLFDKQYDKYRRTKGR